MAKRKEVPGTQNRIYFFSLITCTQHWCRKSQLTHTINVNICAALGRKSDWWSVLYNFDCFNTMGCGCIVVLTMWYPIIDTFDHLDSRLHITIVSVAFYDLIQHTFLGLYHCFPERNEVDFRNTMFSIHCSSCRIMWSSILPHIILVYEFMTMFVRLAWACCRVQWRGRNIHLAVLFEGQEHCSWTFSCIIRLIYCTLWSTQVVPFKVDRGLIKPLNLHLHILHSAWFTVFKTIWCIAELWTNIVA